MMRDYLHRMAGQYLDTADWTDEERLGEEADELAWLANTY